MIVDAHGVRVPLPRGWDARIRWAAPDPTDAPPALRLPGAAIPAGGTTNVVVHIANFRLPAVRGDYGSGAVERMTSRHVFASIVEFDPEASSTALFAPGGLPRIRAAKFHPAAMQRVLPRMCGAQWFVEASGRAFCLYAVLGSFALRRPLAAQLDAAVRTVTIAPR